MTTDLIRTLIGVMNLILIAGVFIIIVMMSAQLRSFFNAATILLIALNKKIQKMDDPDE